MKLAEGIGLTEFLTQYPAMALRPSSEKGLRLKGRFAFIAEHHDYGKVSDSYNLEILIPDMFPQDLPTVRETEGRIPRTGEFHVNADGSLCLGSSLRLLLKVSKEATLSGFASRCLVPYLYAISLKLRNGGPLVFGELAHFGPGMLQDYSELFSVTTLEQARNALIALTLKKRLANKRLCPCGCGLRLGRCPYRRCLARYRKLASRGWFKRQVEMIS